MVLYRLLAGFFPDASFFKERRLIARLTVTSASVRLDSNEIKVGNCPLSLATQKSFIIGIKAISLGYVIVTNVM